MKILSNVLKTMLNVFDLLCYVIVFCVGICLVFVILLTLTALFILVQNSITKEIVIVLCCGLVFVIAYTRVLIR